MAQNTLFDYRKTDGSPSRNVFDLSRRDVFGCNIGELIPCFCQEVVPGDKFKVHVADLVRVMPLVSSPFVRMKQHLDFYFVPYEQIWSNWLNFVNMKDDFYSAAQKERLFIPYVSGRALNAVADTSSNTVNDVLGRSGALSSYKLLDMLGYGSRYWNESAQQPLYPTNDKYNLFRIAAYNKIWYDYYRQKYYDDGTNGLTTGQNAASLFNFDDLGCYDEQSADISNTVGVLGGQPRLNAMLQMRYRCWKKDLYTGLLPTTQQGAVSSVMSPVSVDTLTGMSAPSGKNILFGSSAGLLHRGSVPAVPSSGESLTDVGRASLSGTSAFDILEFRRANAVQKWRENALRAGNRVEDSQRVRFGKKPYYHNDTHPAFLGSISSSIQISDVNATSQNGTGQNQQLGDYVGKGIMSFDGNAFTFDTGDNGDYGVIMGIYSVLPDSEYNARGIDYANCLLEVEDFFQPEYDKLGFAAVPNKVFSNVFGQQDNIRGYAPNYWYYKYALDKVHGEFQIDRYISGNMNMWASPRQYAGLTDNVELSDFYVNYHCFDNQFVIKPDLTEQDTGLVEYNNFAVDLYCEVHAIRPMSILGLPEI